MRRPRAGALRIGIRDRRLGPRDRSRSAHPRVEIVEERVLLATLTVNTTLDSNTRDSVLTLREAILVANNTGSLPFASLTPAEQAQITDGTPTPGSPPDTIAFNIGGGGVQTIVPTSALPEITDPTIIDGYTQPGAQPNTFAVGNNAVLRIELNGANLGPSNSGLVIRAGDSTVRGLVINRFSDSGIFLSTNGGNRIAGNFLGTDATGTQDLGNTNRGLFINNSLNNTIGGVASGDRNVISGNGDGVVIFGSGSMGNRMLGNYIGTNASGMMPLGNRFGVFISNAPGNTIGVPNELNPDGTIRVLNGNVISGNGSSGVRIFDTAATGNVVQGNLIGTDATGVLARGNGSQAAIAGLPQDDGVFIESPRNTIGGTAAGAGNLISGNAGSGVDIRISGATGNVVLGNLIGTDITGTQDLGNASRGVVIDAPNNTIGGTAPAARNVISGNRLDGVLIRNTGSTGNLVQGNFLGTDVTGTAPLGNGDNGVAIIDAPNNTIGGTVTGARNVISANNIMPPAQAILRGGISIQGGGATGTLVQGNFIGTDVTGTRDLGNAELGVSIVFAPGNTIGGTTPEARNLISGNGLDGIRLGPGALVQGNFIGTDVTGTRDLGNAANGIFILGSNNTIGGLTTTPGTGAGNVISGNGQSGISIPGTTGNLVRGNLIGTDATGTVLLSNVAGVGISSGASVNTIGGSAAGARNIIVNNGGATIAIAGLGVETTANVVQGNYFGTNITGTATLGLSSALVLLADGTSGNTIGGATAGAGNLISGHIHGVDIGGVGTTGNLVLGNLIGTDATGVGPLGNNRGVIIRDGASANTIGGTAAGAANTIAFNNVGIFVVSGTSNAILSNAIFSNSGLGIDLGLEGVTLNDPGDPDTGPNNLQNFPVLTGATFFAGNTSIGVTLNSTANTTFTFQFFANPAGDPDEGRTFLGQMTQTTDEFGNARFTASFATPPTLGQFITATVTSLSTNDTSEFSQALIVASPFTVTNTNDSGPGSLRQAILNANATPGLDTITFAILGPGVQTISPVSRLPEITDAVIIDGYTQPGTSRNTMAVGNNAVLLIQLSGTGDQGVDLGLIIRSSGSTVRGMVINRFANSGIFVSGSNDVIEGNFIGTDASGTSAALPGPDGIPGTPDDVAIGNRTGVDVFMASNNTIGGAAAGARNIISGNSLTGIHVRAGATANVLQGNFIGTAVTGTVALGNGADGIIIEQASANTVGGAADGARNLISGNLRFGVLITVGTGNLVAGNFIGTNAAGTAVLGNRNSGVAILNAPGNTVGGTVAGARNLISGNGASGVNIGSGNATGNVVVGNFIGTDVTGTVAMSNALDGVLVDFGASGNSVGGATPGAGNTIAFNGGAGVSIVSGSGNALRGNAIFANAGLGIDLGGDGVTPNDPGDADVGPNGLQNAPTLEMAIPLATGTRVVGTVHSTPNTAFTIELFVGAAPDPSGFGEGSVFLGVVVATTDGAGNVRFVVDLAFAAGGFLTATATDPAGNTSEFSRSIPIAPAADLSVSVSASPEPAPLGGLLTFTVTVSNNGPSNATGVVVTNTLPPAVTFISAASSQGGAGPAGGIVRADLGTLPAGGSATVTVVVRSETVGTLTNFAAVAGIEPDPNPSNNSSSGTSQVLFTFTVMNTQDEGPGSLRQAIGNANARPDPDFILFAIPGDGPFRIRPTTALPEIIDPIIIDGYSQPGASPNTRRDGEDAVLRIVLSGSNLRSGGSGLVISAGGSTVRGLAITDFRSGDGSADAEEERPRGFGIVLRNRGGNRIEGNFIGTDPSGNRDQGNGRSGVAIVGGSAGNTIGGLAASQRNVISGNGEIGVRIAGGARDNLVLGNFIGIDPDGTQRLGNGLIGVFLQNATGNTIGGSAPGARNIISGNGSVGIRLFGNASGNVVQGNFIGTNAAGSAALPNLFDGVFIDGGASNNTIGGAVFGEGNVISGNGSVGVQVFGRRTTGNVIQGNRIGLTADGTGRLGNGSDGVYLNRTAGNTVVANVIVESGSSGVQIFGPDATGNIVQANFIAGNQFGLFLNDARGGDNTIEANTIEGNEFADVFDTSAPPAMIQSARLIGDGSGVRGILLTFSRTELNRARVRDIRNYRVVVGGAQIRIRAASYNRSAGTVTLTFRRPIPRNVPVRLTVFATARRGLLDVMNRLLDGDGDGQPGGNFVGVSRPDGVLEPSRRRRMRAAAEDRLSARAVDRLLSSGGFPAVSRPTRPRAVPPRR